MGQSALLYRIDKIDFPKIIENPDDFGLFKITKGYEIFVKSFEGLQFVLSKGLDNTNKNLIELILAQPLLLGKK